MPQVSVSINGKAYRMACDEGEQERLIGLAGKFDAYVEQLKASFGEIGDQRLTVMAAIMVVDELSEARGRLEGLEAELASLRESRAALVEHQETATAGLAARLDEAAARIEQLAASLASGGLEELAGT